MMTVFDSVGKLICGVCVFAIATFVLAQINNLMLWC